MNRFRPSTFARIRPRERGVTILLIAVAMLFMILAIAAIAIDVGAMYTARGEAKHAADAAALAGAKVLADSGMTSDPTNATLQTAATTLATQIATSVATQNKVGGRTLASGEVTVSFPNSANASFVITPQVSVTVQRTDLPTFFAKAWGRSTVAVGATSVAEAVNPSNSATVNAGGTPVAIAPSCVKPWIIPNWNPNAATPFFDPVTGKIKATGMVGTPLILRPDCAAGGCSKSPVPAPGADKYYPASFNPPPANQEPVCTPSSCTNGYEDNIAACTPDTITCGVSPNAAVDFSKSCPNYRTSTNNATSCLIHSPPSPGQDTITPLTQPMHLLAGAGNPLVTAGKVSTGDQVTASDSLVTIPVYDGTPLVPSGNTAPVNVVGFIQGFIVGAGPSSGLLTGQVKVIIVNMSGCGTGATGAPVVGNGLSPVPVHLITPP